MILHLYFTRKFLINFGLVSLVFAGVVVLTDMVENIRRFDDDVVGVRQAFELALLHAPSILYQILPLLVVLSSLSMFLGLARTSELVVTRAAGRSAIRALLAPAITAATLGVLAVSIWNPISAATEKHHAVVVARYESGTTSTVSVTAEGLWLRQADRRGQTVIHARRTNGEGTELDDVTFLGFDHDFNQTFRIAADRAVLGPGGWMTTNAKRWAFDVSNPESAAETHEALVIPSELTRDTIRDSFGAPSEIPIWELPSFIAEMEEKGFAARSHKVWFWMEMAQPLLLTAMVMIAAGFTMRHTRLGRTGIMVLFALMFGFGLFFLKNFTQVLGENGQIPILLAAWSPPLAGIFLSLGLLFRTEDG